MNFFKPTKIKVALTIVFFSLSALYYIFFFLNWYGTTLIDWCLPSIPSLSGGPTPTPEPVSVAQTISDVTRIENPLPLGNYGDLICTSDPSAQIAAHIVDISKIVALILYIFIIYLVACTIVVLLTRTKKQKVARGNVKK